MMPFCLTNYSKAVKVRNLSLDEMVEKRELTQFRSGWTFAHLLYSQVCYFSFARTVPLSRFTSSFGAKKSEFGDNDGSFDMDGRFLVEWSCCINLVLATDLRIVDP